MRHALHFHTRPTVAPMDHQGASPQALAESSPAAPPGASSRAATQAGQGRAHLAAADGTTARTAAETS